MRIATSHLFSVLGGAAGTLLVFALGGTQTESINAQRLRTLTPEQAQVLSYMSVVQLPDGAGNLRATIRLSAVNLQLVDGLGATNGFPPDPITPDPALTAVNGLGNLIVGYRDSYSSAWPSATLEGSHNIVIGGNNASTYGGIVGGFDNWSGGPYGAILSGRQNAALGVYSSVSGGVSNQALGVYSNVSGGSGRSAGGTSNWAAGGLFQNK